MKRNQYIKRLSLLLIFGIVLFGPCKGIAVLKYQNIDTVSLIKEIKLSPVDIHGKKINKNIGVFVQKMSGIELERFNPQQVGEIVKQFAGVVVKDYGGIGGIKTVSVRSLGAAHTAVVYDGVVLSDAQNGQIDLSKISMESIKSLSLSNAMPTGLFKSARQFSAASVLEIEEKSLLDGDKNSAVEFSLTGGSFGLWTPYVGYEQRISNRVRLCISGKYTNVKGNYPYTVENGEYTEEYRRGNADVQNGIARLKLQLDLPENQMLDFDFYYNESERGLPGAVILYAPTGGQRWHERAVWGQIKHFVDYGEGFSQKSFAKYEYNYTRFLDPESLNSEGIEDDRYQRQEIYLSTVAQYILPKHKAWMFTTALDASYAFLNANTSNFVYPHRTSLWFNIAGAYRHRYIEVEANLLTSAYFEGVKVGGSAEDKARLSPSISIGIKPLGRPDFVIRAFYKDVFRMPTFNDLYYDRVGNTGLKPEKAKILDIGLSYLYGFKQGNIEISVDFFKNWVTDKIVAFPTKNLFRWSMMNIGKASITGVEAMLKGNIIFGKDGFAQYCSVGVFGSYTFQHSIDVTDKADRSYGSQIVYTPRHISSGGLSIAIKYISLTYGITWSGERYCLPENIDANRLEPYINHSLSLNGKWKMLKGDWEAGVEYLNVANTSYEIVKYYPMPGSEFRISLKCRY